MVFQNTDAPHWIEKKREHYLAYIEKMVTGTRKRSTRAQDQAQLSWPGVSSGARDAKENSEIAKATISSKPDVLHQSTCSLIAEIE